MYMYVCVYVFNFLMTLFVGAVMPSLGIHTIMYTASCMAVLGML